VLHVGEKLIKSKTCTRYRKARNDLLLTVHRKIQNCIKIIPISGKKINNNNNVYKSAWTVGDYHS